MILNLTIHDNKRFKNETIFSFEASTSTAKLQNVVEYNVAGLKKPLQLLKLAALYGNDEDSKDDIFEMLYRILGDGKLSGIEKGTFIKLCYLHLNKDTQLIHKYTLEICYHYNGKSYLKCWYIDSNKEEVTIVNIKSNDEYDLWWFYNDLDEDTYTKFYESLPKIITEEIHNVHLSYDNDMCFRVFYHLVNSNHEPRMLEYMSALLQVKVIDCSGYNIKYIDKNGKEVIKNIEDYSYDIRISLTFIIALFTNSNTLFVVDRVFDLIHPHIVRFLLNVLHSEEVYTNNQVLFSSHNTELIKTDYMRCDQIWFVEKNDDEVVNLFSVQDFEGIREDVPFDKWYLAGKFGAIPDVNMYTEYYLTE